MLTLTALRAIASKSFLFAKLAWIWGTKHTTIVAALAAALAGALLSRRGGDVAGDRLAVAIDAANAKSQANSIAAREGADVAHAHVATTYATQIQALDERQTSEAKQLESDPGALAAYLVRVGNSLATPPK